MKQADIESTLHTLMEVTKVLQRRIEEQQQTITALVTFKVDQEAWKTQIQDAVGELQNELLGQMNGFEEGEDYDYENEDAAGRNKRLGIHNRLAEIEALVRGRNSSAPVKRNMVDDDARRVLNGDCKDLGHKEAGEKVGLTYAQVYSCRLEYTFKHIHKELREKGWKNPFVKK